MHAFVSMNPVRRRRLGIAIRSALLAAALVPAFGTASDVRDESSVATAPADATARVRYTILLKGEPLATYRGGVPGFAPAARFESGRKVGRLDVKAPASRAYVAYLADRQHAFVQSLGAAIGRPLAPVATMQHALNAVIIELDEREAEIARSRADVELVEREEIRALLTDRGPAFIGAPSIWDGSASNGIASQGEGIVVADLDTGINWQSPAFAATGEGDGYVHTNPNGTGVYIGLCGPTPPNADFGHCNDKLIGMYDFTSTSATRSGNDLDGHGSHTASTIAGNHWTAPFGGGTFDISGVAPHANIIAYRVCTTGCSTTASSQATNQAVIDGADVLNFSISGGVSPWGDSVSIAFRNAVAAGVFVAASAGNDGPVAGSTNHTEPWVETVAASTKDNVVGFRFNLTQPSSPPETQDRPLRPAAPPLPTESLVDVPFVKSPTFDDGSNDGCTAFAPDTFTVSDTPSADTIFANGFDPETTPGRIGAVAVLALDQNASNCGSVSRRQAALDAGAVGVIFVDRDFINLGASETSWSMLRADWDAVWAVAEADPEHARASLLLPASSFPQRGDVVADFSSRGPRATGGQYLIKPDITAPGVDILAAYTSETGGATSTAMENGTSMSSPHVTGSAALLRAVQPTWTPSEVRSAINLTSKIAGLINADGSDADPFDLGSGRVDLTKAALSGLVLDETDANFLAANPSSGGDLSTLNLASMASNDCATTCTFTRTLKSTLVSDRTYTLADAGLGGGIDVSPASFTISAGATQVITVTVNGSALPAGWSFGEISLTPDSVTSPVLRMPIAIQR
jgi:subtilisin family serine protease